MDVYPQFHLKALKVVTPTQPDTSVRRTADLIEPVVATLQSTHKKVERTSMNIFHIKANICDINPALKIVIIR